MKSFSDYFNNEQLKESTRTKPLKSLIDADNKTLNKIKQEIDNIKTSYKPVYEIIANNKILANNSVLQNIVNDALARDIAYKIFEYKGDKKGLYPNIGAFKEYYEAYEANFNFDKLNLENEIVNMKKALEDIKKIINMLKIDIDIKF